MDSALEAELLRLRSLAKGVRKRRGAGKWESWGQIKSMLLNAGFEREEREKAERELIKIAGI